jgi:hypothetical protein
MDAVAELAAEHVVDEAVLGDPREAGEHGGDDHGLEVVAVIAPNISSRAGDPGLDPLLQLFLGCHAGCHLALKGSERKRSLYLLKQ